MCKCKVSVRGRQTDSEGLANSPLPKSLRLCPRSGRVVMVVRVALGRVRAPHRDRVHTLHPSQTALTKPLKMCLKFKLQQS